MATWTIWTLENAAMTTLLNRIRQSEYQLVANLTSGICSKMRFGIVLEQDLDMKSEEHCLKTVRCPRATRE